MAINREKFVELMRRPESMSAADYAALEKLLAANPYFQGGHTLLAKASRMLKKKTTGKVTQHAAIYATDRGIFKNFLLKPTAQPKTKSAPSTQPQSPKSPTQRAQPKGNVDGVINEIYENLAQWDQHRHEYLEWDKAHPEDIVILPAKPAENTDAVEKLKNQVAEEVKAEETKEQQVSAPPVANEEELAADPISATPSEDTAAGDIPDSTIEKEEDYAKDKAEEFEKAKSISFDIISDAASLVDPHHKDKIEAETTPEQAEAMKHQEEEIEQQLAEEATEAKREEASHEAPATPDVEKATPEPSGVEEIEAPASEEDEVSDEDNLISTEELSEIVDKESGTVVADEMTGVDFSEDELRSFEHKIDEDTGKLTPLADKVESTKPETKRVDKDADESVQETTATQVEEPAQEVPSAEPATDDNIATEEVEDVSTPVEDKITTTKEIPTAIDDTDTLEVNLSIDDDLSTEETEAELNRLDSEKQELKLTPGQSKERKFRLSVMKRSIQFTREKPEKKTKKLAPTQEAKATETENKEVKESTAKKRTSAKKTSTTKKSAKKTQESSKDDEKKKP